MQRWQTLTLQTKAWILRCIVAAVTLPLALLVVSQLVSEQKAVQLLEAQLALDSAAVRLQSSLDQSFSSTSVLRSLALDPELNEERFQNLAAELSLQLEGTQSLQLAPDAVVKYVYPKSLDSSVIGHNLLADQAINSLIYRSIEYGEMLLDGPRPLLQGGEGVIARLPIYQGTDFWGFSTVLLRWPDMLEDARLTLLDRQDYRYDLWQVNDLGLEKSLLNQYDLSDFDPRLLTDIDVPNQRWVLGIQSNSAQHQPIFYVYQFVAAILSALLLTEFIVVYFQVRKHRQELQLLVAEQTELIRGDERRLKQAQQVAQLGSWEYTPNESYRLLSEEAKTLMGSRTLESDIDDYTQAIHPAEQKRFTRLLRFRGDDRYSIDYQIEIQDTTEWFREVAEFDQEKNKLIGTVQNITQEKQDQETIWQQAHIDYLTGLPNANLARKKCRDIIRSLDAKQDSLSLMIVDVDNFRRIYDSLTLEAGEDIIKELANRLNRCVINDGFLARVSLDEFVMVFANAHGQTTALEVVTAIQELMHEPFSVNSSRLYLSMSIGVSRWPKDGDTFTELEQAAKIALHEIKAREKGGFQFFRSELREESQKITALEAELRTALKNDEFTMLYQPIVDAQSLQQVGMEALIRWLHPHRGFVPPDVFIPIAESSGSIVALGQWIITQVAKDCTHLIDTTLEHAWVSINASRIQFMDSNFSGFLENCREELFPANQRVTLEITETTLHQDTDYTVSVMEKLQALGLAFSLDDFGTGYSSFISLKEFPIQNLKIDRSFIKACDENEDDRVLIRAIIDMAHTMGFTVTAEGVETKAQAELLQAMGCDYLQGYLFSKPRSMAQLIQHGADYPLGQLEDQGNDDGVAS